MLRAQGDNDWRGWDPRSPDLSRIHRDRLERFEKRDRLARWAIVAFVLGFGIGAIWMGGHV